MLVTIRLRGFENIVRLNRLYHPNLDLTQDRDFRLNERFLVPTLDDMLIIMGFAVYGKAITGMDWKREDNIPLFEELLGTRDVIVANRGANFIDLNLLRHTYERMRCTL